MTPDQIAVAQLNAAVDQGHAAWSAARAAWFQGVLTPLSIFVALVAAFGAPELQRRQDERRIKILAINTAAEAAGAINMLLEISRDPDFVGNVHSDLPLRTVQKALETLDSFPRGRLSDPRIDTALRLLVVQVLAALEITPPFLDSLKQGPLQDGVVDDLARRTDRAAELFEDVYRAANIKIPQSRKAPWRRSTEGRRLRQHNAGPQSR